MMAATGGQGTQPAPLHASIHAAAIPAHVTSTAANVIAATDIVAANAANVAAAPAHVTAATAAANVSPATDTVAASPGHIVAAPAHVAVTAVNISAAPVRKPIAELLNVSSLQQHITVRQANVY